MKTKKNGNKHFVLKNEVVYFRARNISRDIGTNSYIIALPKVLESLSNFIVWYKVIKEFFLDLYKLKYPLHRA